MTEQPVTTKAELIATIEHAWPTLNTALDRLTPSQLTQKDTEGWTVKDHVTHIAAWERSVVFLLQGKPRHAGLDVSPAVYEQGDEDAINAVIQQQHSTLSWNDALTQLRNVHRQMMTLLGSLSDADLQQPYRYYLPDEPGDGDGPPAINVIYGNTAGHFGEHQEWIAALVKEPA